MADDMDKQISIIEKHMAVCADLNLVLQTKLADYGTSRYEISDREFDMTMCYSDIYRKFIRLEQVVKNKDWDALEETCMDLANYAIMAVQIKRRHHPLDGVLIHKGNPDV